MRFSIFGGKSWREKQKEKEKFKEMNVFMQILRDFVCFLFMQIYQYLAFKQQDDFLQGILFVFYLCKFIITSH
jgi:hypothetical protein